MKVFIMKNHTLDDYARKYLQLPLRQWGAGNVYLLALSSWKVNIAKNLIAKWGCRYVQAVIAWHQVHAFCIPWMVGAVSASLSC